MKWIVVAVAFSVTAPAGTLTAFLLRGRSQDSLAASMSSTRTVADPAGPQYARITDTRFNAPACRRPGDLLPRGCDTLEVVEVRTRDERHTLLVRALGVLGSRTSALVHSDPPDSDANGSPTGRREQIRNGPAPP
jgi:hypothetical protein